MVVLPRQKWSKRSSCITWTAAAEQPERKGDQLVILATIPWVYWKYTTTFFKDHPKQGRQDLYVHLYLSPQIESTVNRTTFCSFRQLRKFYLCILVTQPTPRVTNAVKKRAKYGKKRDFQIQHGCRDCTLYLGTQLSSKIWMCVGKLPATNGLLF